MTLPLSLPGVATGSMLVFILLMGEFLIPALLGGGKVFFIGNALVDLFLQSRNWPFGAAVAMALVAIMLATVTVYMRLVLGRGAGAATCRCSEPMRVYAGAAYLFLYLPIALIVLFSFNAGRYATDLQGFSPPWYGKALANPFMVEALQTSLIVGLTSAVLATLFGTMAALALQRVRGGCADHVRCPGLCRDHGPRHRHRHRDAGRARDPVRRGQPGDGGALARHGRAAAAAARAGSLIAAHALFTMALAILIVRARLAGMDRSLVEASMDLYATPWATFRQIALPQLLPAIVASFLLAFTFSFDDFVIAFFVAGAEHDPADLCLRLDPPRRHARDQRHRHHGSRSVADADDYRPAAPAPAARPHAELTGSSAQCSAHMSSMKRRRCTIQHRRASTGGNSAAARSRPAPPSQS